MMENFLDDKVIIPDDLKRMTREDRRAEIARLEKEAANEKTAILRARTANGAANTASLRAI